MLSLLCTGLTSAIAGVMIQGVSKVTVGVKKNLFGIAMTVILMGIAIPAGFWLLSEAIDRSLSLTPVPDYAVFQILAATAFLIGIFWISWAYSYLVFVGMGLPLEAFGKALHPTRYLVTTGPYAYTRNPMILGLVFILLGIAFLQRSVAGLISVPIITGFISLYLVEFEEKALHKRFGKKYDEYSHNVPLLIPRMKPYIKKPASSKA